MTLGEPRYGSAGEPPVMASRRSTCRGQQTLEQGYRLWRLPLRRNTWASASTTPLGGFGRGPGRFHTRRWAGNFRGQEYRRIFKTSSTPPSHADYKPLSQRHRRHCQRLPVGRALVTVGTATLVRSISGGRPYSITRQQPSRAVHGGISARAGLSGLTPQETGFVQGSSDTG